MADEEQQPQAHARRFSFVWLRQAAIKGIQTVHAFVTKFNNDWSMPFSGMLAYSLLTAMLPLAIGLIAILGFILGTTNSQFVIDQVIHVFPGLAGQQNAIELAQNQLAKSAGFLAVIAISLAIFSGSRLFIRLEGCLNIIYRERSRPFIRRNIMAIGMCVLFIILVPIMVFTSAAPPIILDLLKAYPALHKFPFFSAVANNPNVTYAMAILGGLIAAFIFFETIYFVVPNHRIRWSGSWHGALGAALAMTFFLDIFFPFYSTHFLTQYVGQIGFAVILLLFFYYFAVILLLGAEVNAFFSEGLQPLPDELATFVTTTAGKLKGDSSAPR